MLTNNHNVHKLDFSSASAGSTSLSSNGLVYFNGYSGSVYFFMVFVGTGAVTGVG